MLYPGALLPRRTEWGAWGSGERPQRQVLRLRSRRQRAASAAAFLERVLAHFAQRGIHSQRLLTDNGRCYISRVFQQVAATHGISLKRTRPYRPQTNGKAEAFIKILQAEWAYSRPYDSNSQRLDLLPTFLGYYNHQRPHGGIGGLVPTSRL